MFEFIRLEGENEEDLTPMGYTLVTAIREYEGLLGLRHPENPPLKEGQTMAHKVEIATDLFMDKATRGEIDGAYLSKMSRELNMLTWRLASISFNLTSYGEIVLLPSKRNYLYAGEDTLMGILEDLIPYKNLSDPNITNRALKTLIEQVAKKADKSCEGLMEFRIINILIVSLRVFIEDRQTISFLAQLMVRQEEQARRGY